MDNKIKNYKNIRNYLFENYMQTKSNNQLSSKNKDG